MDLNGSPGWPALQLISMYMTCCGLNGRLDEKQTNKKKTTKKNKDRTAALPSCGLAVWYSGCTRQPAEGLWSFLALSGRRGGHTAPGPCLWSETRGGKKDSDIWCFLVSCAGLQKIVTDRGSSCCTRRFHPFSDITNKLLFLYAGCMNFFFSIMEEVVDKLARFSF